MIQNDVEQRSLQWHRLRFGSFTGSRISAIMGAGRKKDSVFSETAKSYIYQIAAERMFDEAFLNDDEVFQDYLNQTSVTSRAMQWGVEQEKPALNLYLTTYAPEGEYAEVSLCAHDTIPHFGASPDGLVYYNRPNGLVRTLEIKCPNINTHMLYRTEVRDAESLLRVKPEYYWQIMAEMSCTGADEAAFISYCPYLSDPIHTIVIPRDDEAITKLEARVTLAGEYVDKIIRQEENIW